MTLGEISGEIEVYADENAMLNLKNQDFSKEILSDLVRKDIAEFSDQFSHFHYTTLEMFKAALNNYSVLKLPCFNQHPHFCNVL